MFSLIAQSGQNVAGIEEWIAESIEEMVSNERLKYAKPGSTCIVITEDKDGHGVLQKYMLYFGNKWILIEENTGSAIITPEGINLEELVQQAVEKEMSEGYVKKEDGAIEALDKADGESNLITESELNNRILSGGSALDI